MFNKSVRQTMSQTIFLGTSKWRQRDRFKVHYIENPAIMAGSKRQLLPLIFIVYLQLSHALYLHEGKYLSFIKFTIEQRGI